MYTCIDWVEAVVSSENNVDSYHSINDPNSLGNRERSMLCTLGVLLAN